MGWFGVRCNVCFFALATRFALLCRSPVLEAWTKAAFASSGWDSDHIYAGNTPF